MCATLGIKPDPGWPESHSLVKKLKLQHKDLGTILKQNRAWEHIWQSKGLENDCSSNSLCRSECKKIYAGGDVFFVHFERYRVLRAVHELP